MAARLDLHRTPADNDVLSMPSILTKVFGSANERTLKRLWPVVGEINDLEERFKDLPPEDAGLAPCAAEPVSNPHG